MMECLRATLGCGVLRRRDSRFRLRRVCAVVAGTFFGVANGPAVPNSAARIDRHALVSRHDVTWTDPRGVMPLGNGEFCFNADGTGLQTFGGNTMAHWAWHSFPMPAGMTADQVPATGTFQKGRPTGGDPWPSELGAVRSWLSANPHSFDLGRLRLRWSDGREVAVSEITELSSRVELWSGQQTSRFKLDGVPVQVWTSVHPKFDAVAVKIESALLGSNKLEVDLDFPYPSLKRDAWMGDFAKAGAHKTELTHPSGKVADFRRKVDGTTYYARLSWSAGELREAAGDPHRFSLSAKGQKTIELSLCYASEAIRTKLPGFAASQKATIARWEDYWKTGGAIDLSESRDPRWKELERRIVLSQYHMAAQSAGSNPPAEAGLMLVDNWGSRFHMEMVWWHLAHYALWDRWQMADKALAVYHRFLPLAMKRAQQFGLRGASWPKGVGPDGISQPWNGNLALLWKQPHPMFFAELEYRLKPTRATLEKWAPILNETAEYMAGFAQLDPATKQYYLTPDMPPGEQGLTTNSVFDLAYWRWGLDQAQLWRERMKLARVGQWDEVRRNLTPLPTRDGLFVHSTEWPDTYTKRNYEHPDPVGVFGMLPPVDGVDAETAHRTVREVVRVWQWERTWGWDYPWTAMAAARVGEPKLAVDSLLMNTPKNVYDWRGVNEGGPCPYLPGNGGLLYAAAMMAVGWDGAPNRHAPGFPNDGSWTVKWEGLKLAP